VITPPLRNAEPGLQLSASSISKQSTAKLALRQLGDAKSQAALLALHSVAENVQTRHTRRSNFTNGAICEFLLWVKT
jgi:hypothetical protein